MSIDRLRDIPGFNIDRVAAAGSDPEVLRLEIDPFELPRQLATTPASR